MNKRFWKKISPTFFFVIFGLLLIGAALVYKYVPVTDLFNSASATESDFSFINDSLIQKHFASQVNTPAYQMKTVRRDSLPDTVYYTAVQIVGDDFRYTTWKTISGQKSSEFLSMDDTLYVKDYSDNVWWKQTFSPNDGKLTSKETGRLSEDIKEDYLTKQNIQYTKLAEENCNQPARGQICYKYEEIDLQNPDARRLFWFDKIQLRLRKEETSGNVWEGITEYDYNNINVSAPSPTKDVPEGKTVYDYLVM